MRHAESEIYTIRLNARAEPIGEPQRLTTVLDGGGSRPTAFPLPDGGYTLIYAAAGRAAHPSRWELMTLGPECFD